MIDPQTDVGPDPSADRREPEEALAEGMRFEGLLVLPRAARIDGHVGGEVLAGASLEVGETGTVEADLEAEAVVVHGCVLGDVLARESIELGPGAVVRGDITAPRLAIAEGARVDGRCHCGGPAA
jgi:cytoskeletal protein CcmA (bactofilin family)